MKRRKEALLGDLALINSYLNLTLNLASPSFAILTGEALQRIREDLDNLMDNCEVCGGTQGGLPGSERLVRVSEEDYKNMCRQCEIDFNLEVDIDE